MERGVPWAAVRASDPELAAVVSARLAARRHHVLATHRRDGSIRLSGIEVWQREGELVLGMLAGSVKALDVGRDPRCALHSQPEDRLVTPDVKLWGELVALCPEELEAFRAAVCPPEPTVAYHLRVLGMASVVVAPNGTELEIRSWTAPEVAV